MTPDDYQKWASGSTSGASLAQNGERLFASLGCNSCHSGEATARGPNLAQVYGSRLQLTDGSTVTANDAFLRESILNPSTRVTAGYAPIMPTYQGQVSEEGLIDLVEYIKNLNSNYRIQQTLTTSQLSSGQAGASTRRWLELARNELSASTDAGGRSRWTRKAGRTAPTCPGR